MGDYEKNKRELKKQKARHFNIGLVTGIILLLILFIFVFFTNIPALFLVILIIIFLVFYAVVLFFLIEQITILEHQTERIKTIEKYLTIDNPIIHRVEVEKPVIKHIPVPVYVEKKRKIPRGKRFKYFASKTGKIFHYRSSRLARLIRPKNRIQNDSPAWFIKKGYKPSARTLRRWKTEEKDLYRKYGKKKKAKKVKKKKTVKKKKK